MTQTYSAKASYPINKNLTCTDSQSYRGFPIQTAKGLLIEEYLERSYQTLQHAIAAHPRTLALRIDLHVPQECTQVPSDVISRFIEQLKRIICQERKRAAKMQRYPKHTDLRFVWVRERQHSKHDHFHLMLFLNRDVYHVLGNKKALSGNMAARIKQAWARALKLFVEDAVCGVSFSPRGEYRVDADDFESQAAVFHRLSYLCKPRSKQYGFGKRNFGCSRG